MSNQFLAQLSKLQQLLAAPNTLGAYTQVFVVTYNIIKESLVLVWLTLCLVLVLFDWISTSAISTGQRSKTLLENLKQVKSEEFASETGKSILSAGKAGLAYTISQARDQLGLSEKPSEPTVSIAEK
ncbi:MAG: hypothetical protein KME11_21430 [Timaviella obliquedivisa GSE-PSE-MK23-08B]|jgi:hypothetical protein|nr:hypothetical protein [Timaviella obliquedivisa GSE-PSE-MK23-08B]